MSLADLAAHHGTDKGSHPIEGCAAKNYTVVYERLLESRRREPLSLLEIGVRHGASLAMWRDYLPRARIVGLDINPRCSHPDGTEVLIGDQADPTLLARIASDSSWDVIVDDGSHRTADIIASMEVLLPVVRPGGWYAVEDLSGFGGSAGKIRAIRDITSTRKLTLADNLVVIHA